MLSLSTHCVVLTDGIKDVDEVTACLALPAKLRLVEERLVPQDEMFANVRLLHYERT